MKNFFGARSENLLKPEDEQYTLTELMFNKLNDNNNLIYAVIIVFWSTIVVESWKRKEIYLADVWLMRDFFDPTLERPKFRPRLDIDEDTRGILRKPQRSSFFRLLILGLPVTLFFMACVIYCVLATQLKYDEYYKDKKHIPFFASFIPSTALTIYVTVFSLIFRPIANKLTDLEDHQWEASHENSLIAKTILFSFVNAYIGNFIYAFYHRDFMLLAKNVATLMAFSQIFSNALEFIMDRWWLAKQL
jgi:hypothetical protein